VNLQEVDGKGKPYQVKQVLKLVDRHDLKVVDGLLEVSKVQDTEFGRKYTVLGELKGPIGAAQMVTVWIQEVGQLHVRLVTVRPR